MSLLCKIFPQQQKPSTLDQFSLVMNLHFSRLLQLGRWHFCPPICSDQNLIVILYSSLLLFHIQAINTSYHISLHKISQIQLFFSVSYGCYPVPHQHLCPYVIPRYCQCLSINSSLEHSQASLHTKSGITLFFEKDLATLLSDLPVDLHFTQEEIQTLQSLCSPTPSGSCCHSDPVFYSNPFCYSVSITQLFYSASCLRHTPPAPQPSFMFHVFYLGCLPQLVLSFGLLLLSGLCKNVISSWLLFHQ